MKKWTVNAAFIGGGVSSVVGLGIYSERCKEVEYNSFSGSSIGAVIAVCLADGKDPFEVKEFLQSYVEEFCVPIKGRFAIEKRVNEFLGVKSLHELKNPCTVAITPLSLNSKAPRILDNCTYGFNCGQAVAASAAFPGIFLPKILKVNEKRYLCTDGGFTSNPPLPHTGKKEEFVNDVFGFFRPHIKPRNRYISVPHSNLYFAPTETGLTGISSDVRTAFYEGANYYRMLQGYEIYD